MAAAVVVTAFIGTGAVVGEMAVSGSAAVDREPERTAPASSAPEGLGFPESGDPHTIGSRTSGDAARSVTLAGSGADICRAARKSLRWYVRWEGFWRNKTGARADRVLTPAQTSKCPRALSKRWRTKARAARYRYERWREHLNRDPRRIALHLLRYDRAQFACLMSIVRVENARMDPTLDYGGGHGNVYEAYGIPQANPGTKMASHGADWRTNPWTQLRWMIDYCRERYGSVCGAAYSRRARGFY